MRTFPISEAHEMGRLIRNADRVEITETVIKVMRRASYGGYKGNHAQERAAGMPGARKGDLEKNQQKVRPCAGGGAGRGMGRAAEEMRDPAGSDPGAGKRAGAEVHCELAKGTYAGTGEGQGGSNAVRGGDFRITISREGAEDTYSFSTLEEANKFLNELINRRG